MGKLTELQIKNIKPIPNKRVVKYSDGNNLYLEVHKNGIKTWLLRYKGLDGKLHSKSLGAYYKNDRYDVSLAKAREKAVQIQLDLKKGINPNNDISTTKTKAKTYLLANIGKDLIDIKSKNISHKRAFKLVGYLNNHLIPTLGNVDIRTIDTKLIVDSLIELEKKGKTTPKESLGLLNEILHHAQLLRYISNAPDIPLIKKYLTKSAVKNHPHINLDEIPVLLSGISSLVNQRVNPINLIGLKLMVILFIRHGAFIQIKWDNINFEKQTLTVPSEIQKGTIIQKESGVLEQIIPLPTQALELLKQLYEYSGRYEYIFPSDSRSNNKHISIGTLIKILKKVISSQKQDIHGFRGLASTWLNEQYPQYQSVIENMLNHSSKNKVQKAYDHSTLLNYQKELWQAWADFLEANNLKI
ncbi:tyrosine-type recombinase/integrase [Taylorella equigenitalis]|uniref:tyrosine-type recombinase/integrase n=1 Tax=Taylorella equigenitalis TaxID=29575 RepID=UPI00237C65D6|nr:site-specific integrase [Taylorella equigenitalis]WDU48700.1 tyrosine-type recombinase/integrase [Taylorella equigenitalis]WDU51176.1 tyrosine-type recombinase/integrase [Taylorella equigenitalis]